jgi:hypothetical protein
MIRIGDVMIVVDHAAVILKSLCADLIVIPRCERQRASKGAIKSILRGTRKSAGASG